MKSEIKRYLIGQGASVCGVAAVDRFGGAPQGFHPRDLMADCRSVIVFGLAMPRTLLKTDRRITYLKAMMECLAELDRLSFLAAVWLERHGCDAMPIPSDSPTEYWDEATRTAKGVISMKHAAELAGLGRIGKNTLLNNSHFGNRLMLGGVLTDLTLESDRLSEKSLCPSDCTICLENCPQQALNGTTLNQARCRDLVYGKDSRGQDVSNCNNCRTLCPQALRRPRVKEREVWHEAAE